MPPSKPTLRTEHEELLELLAEHERRLSVRSIDKLYPEHGLLRRELYPRHMEFFANGKVDRERAFIAANRIGKTLGVGGYETTLHLTGKYPNWWPGRRFDKPIRAWAAGKTNETTRDIVQKVLIGTVRFENGRRIASGTGLIPGDDLSNFSWKPGVPDLLDTCLVNHVSGGHSVLGIKTYAQGRGAFEGTEQELIWVDEEPDMGVYAECLMRTMTVDGMVICTFTPLEGMSEVVLAFLHPEQLP